MQPVHFSGGVWHCPQSFRRSCLWALLLPSRPSWCRTAHPPQRLAALHLKNSIEWNWTCTSFRELAHLTTGNCSVVSKCVSAAIVTASITNTPGILDFLRKSLCPRLLETNNKGTALRDIPDRTPIQNLKKYHETIEHTPILQIKRLSHLLVSH